MRLATVALLLTLVAAPACGGGGGSDASSGGSPSPFVASFVPDEPAPLANTVAMAEGAKSNDVVTVDVTLTDTNGVFGTAFEVGFDDTHTVYLGFTHGSVFEQGGVTPIYNVSTNPGRIFVGVARNNGTTTDVSGTKVILGLQFRVKQGGVFPVTIENQELDDNQHPPQPLPGILWKAGAVKGV